MGCSRIINCVYCEGEARLLTETSYPGSNSFQCEWVCKQCGKITKGGTSVVVEWQSGLVIAGGDGGSGVPCDKDVINNAICINRSSGVR